MNTHVLIVDDDAAARFLARSVIEEFIPTASVSECASGTETLELLASCAVPPDIVLLDVNMPGQSGPQLMRQLSDLPELQARLARTVFFLISNWDEEKLHQWQLDSDVRTMDKPFGIEDVQTVLAALPNLAGTLHP